MKDSAIPSLFSQLEQNAIHLSIPSTNAKVNNQGVFYDGKTVSATNDFALQFDGSQNYVGIPDSSTIRPTTGTWAIWVKINQISTGNGSAIWSKGDGNSRHGLVIIEFNGTINYQLYDNQGNSNQGSASSAINDGNFHLIVINFVDGGAINFYVDNVLISSATMTSSTTWNTFNSMRFAISNDTFWQPFNGTLDNGAIWNRVLNSTELTNLYSQKIYPLSGLNAQWKMNENSGVTIADNSGNGNTGTLSGSPLPAWVTGASGAYTDSANYTYNQAGVTYGGIYNQDQDTMPLLDSATAEQLSLYILADKLQLSASQTSALLASQGYTYNEATFSYNQIGVEYGGLYNQNQDTTEMSLSFVDLYTPFVPIPGNNQSVGPGFFLFITH